MSINRDKNIEHDTIFNALQYLIDQFIENKDKIHNPLTIILNYSIEIEKVFKIIQMIENEPSIDSILRLKFM